MRHAKEQFRTSNTGHLAVAALPNSVLLDYGIEGRPLDLTDMLPAGARVLWPGGSPVTTPPPAIVVLDGTWSQVRTMRARIRPLPSLPTLDLPPPAVAPLRIRTAPEPGAMATLEAVAAALDVVGEREAAATLAGFFRLVVARQRGMRGERVSETG